VKATLAAEARAGVAANFGQQRLLLYGRRILDGAHEATPDALNMSKRDSSS
jgi:hypothetical protein